MTLLEQLERAVRARRGKTPEDELTAQLYQRYFLDWDGWRRQHLFGDPDFVAQLERAAGGARCIEPGWRVTGRARGGVFASNGEVRLWVTRPRRSRVRIGQPLRLSFPCAREGWMPGYFVLVSPAGRAPEGALAKLYLNLKPEGAPALVRTLVHDARLRRVRFEAKLFNHPLGFGRRDTAVMYFAPRDAAVVVARLQRFVRARPQWVRPEPVPFTLPLGRGLSLGSSLEAEERDGVSYGELRCRLVARAVLRALKRRLPRQRWLDEVRRAFAAAGADFDRPWLSSAVPPPPRGRPGSAAGRR